MDRYGGSLKIEISVGEVVDKATILEIKTEKVKDHQKLENIKKEYALLLRALQEIGISLSDDEFRHLKKINLRLWDIEDMIRVKEARQEFDREFIELARKIYQENDERAKLKKAINLKFNSDLIEEKEYVDY